MPVVPPPQECELDEDRYLRMAQQEGKHPKVVEVYQQMAAVCFLVLSLQIHDILILGDFVGTGS